MRSPEFSEGGRDVIRGSYVDIFLDNHDSELEEYLDTTSGFVSLWSSKPRELMYPIDRASIDYLRQASDDIELHASFDFGAQVVNNQAIKRWDKFLSQKLLDKLAELEQETHLLPHQRQDFYVQLNGVHAVHVQFHTSTHDCHVSFHLEKLSELYYASEGKIDFEPDPDDAEPIDHYDTLHDFSRLFSLAIDTVTYELGEVMQDESPKSVIHIAVPERASSTDSIAEEPTTTTPLRVETNEHGVPLVEADTLGVRGLESVGGLTHAKRRLQDIADMFKDQEGAKLYGLKPNHFVLYGPPGTGKTTLINAFSQDVNAHVMPVDSTSLVDMWVGNSGKHVKNLFAAIRERAEDGEPIVVFMDEFDAIARKGNSGTGEREDVKKRLNVEIDKLSADHPNVIIAAATNSDIMDLEDSIVRSKRIEPIGAPLPNEEERLDIWGAIMLNSMLMFNASYDLGTHDQPADNAGVFIPYGDDIDLRELAKVTEDMTGADFDDILMTARTERFRHLRKTGERTVVTHADLLRRIAQHGR